MDTEFSRGKGAPVEKPWKFQEVGEYCEGKTVGVRDKTGKYPMCRGYGTS